jgi:hypothetical protein
MGIEPKRNVMGGNVGLRETTPRPAMEFPLSTLLPPVARKAAAAGL